MRKYDDSFLPLILIIIIKINFRTFMNIKQIYKHQSPWFLLLWNFVRIETNFFTASRPATVPKGKSRENTRTTPTNRAFLLRAATNTSLLMANTSRLPSSPTRTDTNPPNTLVTTSPLPNLKHHKIRL